MKRVFISLLALTILLSGCVSTQLPPTEPVANTAPSASTDNTTAPTQTDPPETTEPMKAPPLSVPSLPDEIVGVRLDDSVLTQFQRLLVTENNLEFRNFFNMATLCSFDSPENINLYRLFGRGIYIEETELSDKERTHFADQIERSYATAAYRFSPADMDAVLSKYFGITLAESNKVGLDKFEYWEETGCYYLFHPIPKRNDDIEILNGNLLSADTIRLVYWSPGAYLDAGLPYSKLGYGWDITLQATKDGYRILSNTSSSQREPGAHIIPNLPSAEPGTALTKEQLGKFQLMLTEGYNSEEYNFYGQALVTTFSDPREIDLFELFYNGISRELNKLTDTEFSHFSATNEYLQYIDSHTLPPDRMDAILTKYFGITLAESNQVGLEKFTYWDETGCYYWFGTDCNLLADVRVLSGEILSADTVRIDYKSANTETRSVIFKITENSCIVLSNLPV